jgi:hypothetical protein
MMKNIRCASCGKALEMTPFGPKHGEAVGKDRWGRLYYQCHPCIAVDEADLDETDRLPQLGETNHGNPVDRS